MENYNYDFSIIMAAYNVEKYVEEAVMSVIKQRYDLKKIEIIIVDDGSTDNTPQICDKLAKHYKKNIKVIHQKNGGPSKARNAGIEIATGRYLNFLDADDKLEKNALKQIHKSFKLYENEVDAIAIPVFKFGGSNEEHHLNQKFYLNKEVFDIAGIDYKNILKFTNSVFYKKSGIGNIRFDSDVNIGEDVKFNNMVLSQKMKYAICNKTKYMYRVRGLTEQKSLLQSTVENRRYYIDTVEKVFYWTIDYCNLKFGCIPKYFQVLLLNELFWRLNKYYDKPNCLSNEEWETYKLNIKKLFSFIDDKIVLESEFLHIEQICMFFDTKYKAVPNYYMQGDNLFMCVNNIVICNVSLQKTVIEFVDIEDNFLKIEGLLRFVGIKNSDIEIFAEVNGKTIKCNMFSRDDIHNTRLDYTLYKDIGFTVKIPCLKETQEIKIGFSFNGVRGIRKQLSFGKFSAVGNLYRNSYYYKDNYAVRIKRNSICLSYEENKKELEKNFIRALRKKNHFKGILLRLIYKLLKNKNKEYWLISDRAVKADDNGEALFNYIVKYHKKDVKVAFVISKNCEDYKRLKKLGKVINFNSRKFKVHYLLCDKLITSNGDHVMNNPIADVDSVRDILYEKKLIFLQHGVTKDDVSEWLNKYSKNIYKLITATKDEYKSFLSHNYYYTEDNIVLTGFPRFDKLYDNSKNQIVIMPTWRKYLSGVNVKGIWSGTDGIEETEYFKFYNNLINDTRLIDAAKKYNYKIAFLPHPNTYLFCINKFKRNDYVEFLDTDIAYSKVFAESNLLVTDYSSVAFDFAYLKKPIVYCQFDQDTFFSGGHAYIKGYFDYEKDGFGEVCTDLDSTIRVLIEYIENDCKIKQKYLKRIEDTFCYTDFNNCKRVYDVIKPSNNTR